MAVRPLHFDPAGPVMRYEAASETLHLDDLNPEQHMRWKLTRGELLRLGARMILQAIARWRRGS